ncbi:MAG: hypothetical protein OXC46_03345 [Thaumarchaeota archaeon]|nr:hypothetical protein [Nitrososphaerota archaeon]
MPHFSLGFISITLPRNAQKQAYHTGISYRHPPHLHLTPTLTPTLTSTLTSIFTDVTITTIS